MDRLTKRNDSGTYYYYPECFEKCEGKGHSKKCNGCDVSSRLCEKLGAYEDAEEKGLMKILPCGIGDTVYFVKAAFNYFSSPDAQRVIGLAISFDNNITFSTDKGRRFGTEKIGDIVFLTQEDAEKALLSRR